MLHESRGSTASRQGQTTILARRATSSKLCAHGAGPPSLTEGDWQRLPHRWHSCACDGAPGCTRPKAGVSDGWPLPNFAVGTSLLQSPLHMPRCSGIDPRLHGSSRVRVLGPCLEKLYICDTLGHICQDAAALEPACTLAEGLSTQYVLDAARESSASGGGWVTPKRVPKV